MDFQKTIKWVAKELSENRNKAKGNETKGFVKWLEREIGTEIDVLANKTAIKEYHDYDFNHLLDGGRSNIPQE